MSRFVHIKEAHRDEALRQVRALLNLYHDEIDQAYTENDNELSIALTLKLSPERAGIKVNTGINFVSRRCKRSLESTVLNDTQLKLPLGEQREHLPWDNQDDGVILLDHPNRRGYWRVRRSRRGLK